MKQTLNQKIGKQNKIFLKASPEKKRVMIAKDVIKQIKLKKFKVQTGHYFKIEDISTGRDLRYHLDDYFLEKYKKDDKVELQSIIQDKNITCQVCALGGCFSSLININDNFTIDKYTSELTCMSNSNGITKELEKYFTLGQLKLIETAFECFDLPGYVESKSIDLNGEELTLKARKFGEKYKTDKNRLIGIMKNLIKNHGLFIP